MRKFSAEGPQACFSHSRLAWNPPDDATTVLACTVDREAVRADGEPADEAVVEGDLLHLGVVHHMHAEALGAGVERVQQRLAAAEEEGVGAGQVERAGQARLEADAAALQERQRVLRHADGHAGEPLVGLAGGDAQQVVPVLVLAIGLGQHRGGRRVHRAQVAGVAAVAAAHRLGRMLQHHDAGAGLGRGDGGAQGRVAAAEHGDVVRSIEPGHRVRCAL